MIQEKQELPANPTARQIIVVGDDVFLNQAREEEQIWIQKRPEICVVNLDDAWGGELFDKISRQALWVPGTTLVQDPYEPELYMPLKEDEVSNSLLESAKKRYRALEEVVRKLGAISLRIEETQKRNKEGHVIGSGNYKIVDGNAKFDIANQLQESIQTSSTFPGGKPDVQAAQEVLLRYNLAGDNELRSLIELRRGDNPILMKEVKWTTCHELSASLELGVQLVLPGISKGGNLSANLKIASNSMLSWRVEFPAN
ncbi:MAG: hypothetical protein IJ876_05310 [Elusimicrobiaceae bacterium]|nr:hypothetical protein [Elusimicrobiaceae bacterium]